MFSSRSSVFLHLCVSGSVLLQRLCTTSLDGTFKLGKVALNVRGAKTITSFQVLETMSSI